MPVTMTSDSDTHVLALATLGEVTEIIILSVALPKVAKASTIVTVMCCWHWHHHLKYSVNVHKT
jgi:hypothetical protein